MYKYIITLFALVSISNLFSQAPTWESLYKVRPNLSTCSPGELTSTEKASLLKAINEIRAVHKMQPLTYMPDGDAAAQAASLIMVANATLTHEPPSNLLCYSQTGFDGASNSNLHLGSRQNEALDYSVGSIIGWLIDDKSASGDELGHRRAVINPFVNGVAFGRVDGNPKVAEFSSYFATSMAMKYDYFSNSAVGLENDFVAYPYKNYLPVLFNKDFYLSFSAIPDKSNLWANKDVDFSSATISMKDATGKSITISSQKYDNIAWGGMPNNLQWKAAGLVEEMVYNVEIKNVKYKGSVKEYSYWFKLTEEKIDAIPTPVLTSPTNNAINLAQSVAFKWGAVSNAEKYEIMVSGYSNFSTDIHSEFVSGTTFTFDDLENGKTYFWKVRAKKGNEYSSWSNVWKFTTKEAEMAPVVTLLAPPNQQLNFDLLGSLEWSRISPDAGYDLIVSSSNIFADEAAYVVNLQNYTDTTYKFKEKELTELLMYYWKVRLHTNDNSADWSSIFTFTTSKTNSVDDLSFQGAVSELSITPNPVQNNAFAIKFNSKSDNYFDINIYSALGKPILQLNDLPAYLGFNSIPLDASSISNGSYWLVIKSKSGEVYSIRFNVQK